MILLADLADERPLTVEDGDLGTALLAVRAVGVGDDVPPDHGDVPSVVGPHGPLALGEHAVGRGVVEVDRADHQVTAAVGVGLVEQVMDRALLGHPYVKSAIDMACWDLFGQRAGLDMARARILDKPFRPEDLYACVKDTIGAAVMKG